MTVKSSSPGTDAAGPAADPAACWRIDDLAREAGLTVDTIRYYARERLLDPGRKVGRNTLYGRAHLERLQRIEALKRRGFNLAAIRDLMSADRPGLDALFTGTEHEYDLDALSAASGLDAGFVDRLRESGLLVTPAELGRTGYDDSDLALLRNITELLAIGMTETIVVELGKIYVHHFRALQRDVHAMLSGEGRTDWAPDELEAIQRRLSANASRMLPAVDHVLGYVHQRTVQRLTLDAIRRGEETGTGVGGVKLEHDSPDEPDHVGG